MRRLLLLATTILTLVLSCLALVPTAHADLAPGLTVTGQGFLPILVSTDPDGVPFASFSVAAGAAADDVRWSATATSGLTVTNPTGDLGPVAAGQTEVVDLDLTSAGPGLRSLTISVTADGQAPVTATDHYVWTPGSTVVAGHDSLAGHSYAVVTSVDDVGCDGCSTRSSDQIWFVDGSYASSFVTPGQGPPHCPSTTCRPYTYDATTHLAEIGGDVLIRVLPGRAYVVTEDLGEDDTPELFPGLAVPSEARAPHGTWSVDTDPDGLSQVRLHLGHDGRYDLRYAVSGTYATEFRRHLQGRYHLGARGALVLHFRGGRAVHHRRRTKVVTLLVRTDASDRPTSGARGIWLALTYRYHGYTSADGNLMHPA